MRRLPCRSAASAPGEPIVAASGAVRRLTAEPTGARSDAAGAARTPTLAGPAISGRPWVMVNMIASADGATAARRAVRRPRRSRGSRRVLRAPVAGRRRPRRRVDGAGRGLRAARRSRASRSRWSAARARLDWSSDLFTSGAGLAVLPEDGDDRARADDPRRARRTSTSPAALPASSTGTSCCPRAARRSNGQLAAAGLIDELCLTVAPRLVGGDAKRIVVGPPVDGADRWSWRTCSRRTASCSAATSARPDRRRIRRQALDLPRAIGATVERRRAGRREAGRRRRAGGAARSTTACRPAGRRSAGRRRPPPAAGTGRRSGDGGRYVSERRRGPAGHRDEQHGCRHGGEEHHQPSPPVRRPPWVRGAGGGRAEGGTVVPRDGCHGGLGHVCSSWRTGGGWSNGGLVERVGRTGCSDGGGIVGSRLHASNRRSEPCHERLFAVKPETNNRSGEQMFDIAPNTSTLQACPTSCPAHRGAPVAPVAAAPVGRRRTSPAASARSSR